MSGPIMPKWFAVLVVLGGFIWRWREVLIWLLFMALAIAVITRD